MWDLVSRHYLTILSQPSPKIHCENWIDQTLFRETKLTRKFSEQLRQGEINCFRDKEPHGFLEDNERWENITHLPTLHKLKTK